MSIGLIRTGAGADVAAPVGGAYVDDFSNAVGDTVVFGRQANNTSGPAWTWGYSLLTGDSESPPSGPNDLVIRPSSGYALIDTRSAGGEVERLWHPPDTGSPDCFIEIVQRKTILDGDFGIAVRVDPTSNKTFVIIRSGTGGAIVRTNEGFGLGTLPIDDGDTIRLVADGNTWRAQNVTQTTEINGSYADNQIGGYVGIWSNRVGSLDEFGVKVRAGVYPDDI